MDKHDDCVNTHRHMVEQDAQITRIERMIQDCADTIADYSEYLGSNRTLDFVNYIDALASIAGLRKRQSIFIQAIKEIRNEDSES